MGIDWQIAAGYVANGAKVYISSRSASACAQTADRLTKAGPGQCIAIPGDLAVYEECERLAKEMQKREEGQCTVSWLLFQLTRSSATCAGQQLWSNLGRIYRHLSRFCLVQASHVERSASLYPYSEAFADAGEGG